MGADFSLLLLRDPLPPPPPSRRRYRRMRLHNYYSHSHTPQPLITYPDPSTRANTLANRSPTPVSRHVALARLANRLASMGKSRREHVIEQLHIPEDMLQEVRRYTPSNSFGSSADEDDWLSNKELEQAQSAQGSVCSDGEDVDSEVCASPKRPRKIVSFAKYAEMRLF